MPTWKPGDHILVTTTDYLPTHNEEVCIDHLENNNMTVVLGACPAGQPPLPTQLQYLHNATAYTLPSNTPAGIGPRPLPSDMLATAGSQGASRTVETRAAVGLLTRSIEVLSDPDEPDTDTDEHDHFPPSKGYFGGHTVVRQGFTSYQVKGVEFYQLGQGGVIGHYPVHFHMARTTSDDSTPARRSALCQGLFHPRLHDALDHRACDARHDCAAQCRLSVHRPRLLSGRRYRGQ